MPFYPQSVANQGACSNSLLFRCFHLRLTFESIKELGNASPKLLDGLIASPKVKTMEGEGIRAHSLARSTSRVEGRVGTLGWGLGRLTSNSIIHTDLHKSNNKLICA